MPRGKPKKPNNLAPEEESTSATNGSTGLKKSVTHIERYSAPIEPEQLEILPEVRESQVETGKHPFDVVLDDFGARNNEGYIKVYRLPEYAKTGKASPRNVLREFCANIPVTADYEQVIKENWGAGYYQLELRHEDGDFAGGKQICVAAPAFANVRPLSGPTLTPQNGTAANPGQIPAISYELPDPGAQFDAMLDRMAKIRKTFGEPAAQVAQVPEKPETKDPVMEGLLAVTLADENLRQKAIQGVAGILKGNGIPETTFLDIGLELVKQFPEMIKASKQLIMELRGAFQAGGQNGPQTMGTTAPTNHPGSQHGQPPIPVPPVQGQPQNPQVQVGALPLESQTPPEGLTPIDNNQAVINFALSQILGACAQNLPVIEVADRVIEWEENQKCLTPYLDAFLEASPEVIIQVLVSHIPQASQITSLPHTEGWVRSLQERLKALTKDAPEGGKS